MLCCLSLIPSSCSCKSLIANLSIRSIVCVYLGTIQSIHLLFTQQMPYPTPKGKKPNQTNPYAFMLQAPKTSFTRAFLFTTQSISIVQYQSQADQIQDQGKVGLDSPFPIAFRGIPSKTLISCGILYAARRSFSARRISIGPQGFPFRPACAASACRTTTAATFWPHCSEGRPTTAASVIWGLFSY